MKTNNPIRAEIEVSYDYDASYRNFEENFKSSSFKNENLFQYIDWGNVKEIEHLYDLFEITTDDREILLKALLWDEEDADNLTNEDLRDELMSSWGWDDLIDKNNDDGIEILRNFILIETRGYSQGDYAEVIIPTDELRTVWGTTAKVPDEDLVSQEYIDNLFWDAPIWGRIEIFHEEGQDYEFNLYEIESIPEYLNYLQDIDFVNKEIIKFITNKFKHVPALQNILDAIKEALPTEIETPRY